MAETKQIVFSYQEIVETLVKKQGLHDGIWGLFVRFGLKATNIGASDTDLRPAAIIPVLEIGIQRQDEQTNLTVDAAKVNPEPQKRQAKKR
jgi:hypothetical protein